MGIDKIYHSFLILCNLEMDILKVMVKLLDDLYQYVFVVMLLWIFNWFGVKRVCEFVIYELEEVVI